MLLSLRVQACENQVYPVSIGRPPVVILSPTRDENAVLYELAAAPEHGVYVPDKSTLSQGGSMSVILKVIEPVAVPAPLPVVVSVNDTTQAPRPTGSIRYLKPVKPPPDILASHTEARGEAPNVQDRNLPVPSEKQVEGEKANGGRPISIGCAGQVPNEGITAGAVVVVVVVVGVAVFD